MSVSTTTSGPSSYSSFPYPTSSHFFAEYLVALSFFWAYLFFSTTLSIKNLHKRRDKTHMRRDQPRAQGTL